VSTGIWLAIAAVAFPLVGSGAGLLNLGIRRAGAATVVGGAGSMAAAVALAVRVATGGPVHGLGSLLYVDHLSAFFLLTLALVILLASWGMAAYLAAPRGRAEFSPIRIRLAWVFFGVFGSTMLAACETGNLGLLFVLVELSALSSVVMVAIEGRPTALEAAWKYVIVSALGVTIALVGTLFVYSAASTLPGSAGQHLTWPFLFDHAAGLRPAALRLGFVLAVVGYGTKVGLAPMHTWLPDAHSEAPSPVSAMLSGALLNLGMYAIIRFLAIASAGRASAYAGRVLLIFGFLSIGVGAVFIVRRGDYKRLLAYSSVEHMGIIAVGLGFGGLLGVYGALLHTLNHALGKTVLFLASGGILLGYRTRRSERVTGALALLPLTGAALLLGAFAIVGSPPFGLFVSELTIVRAGFAGHDPWLAGLLLLLLAVVFIAFVRTITEMVLGPRPSGVGVGRAELGPAWVAGLPLVLGLAGLLVLGLVIPGALSRLLVESAGLVR